MAKPHAQTHHGRSQRAKDQPPQPDGEAEGGAEAVDSEASVENPGVDDAEDWGLGEGKAKMSKETKIGLALVLVLATAFGVMVYKRLHPNESELAAEKEGADEDADELEGVETTEPEKILAKTPQDDEDLPEQNEPESGFPGKRSDSFDDSQRNAYKPERETTWADEPQQYAQTRNQSDPFAQGGDQFDPSSTNQSDPFDADSGATGTANSPEQNGPVEDLFAGDETGGESPQQTPEDWHTSDTRQETSDVTSQARKVQPLEDQTISEFEQRGRTSDAQPSTDTGNSTTDDFSEPSTPSKAGQPDPNESWNTASDQFEPAADAGTAQDWSDANESVRHSNEFRQPAKLDSQQEFYQQNDEFRQDAEPRGDDFENLENSQSKTATEWNDTASDLESDFNRDGASQSWDTSGNTTRQEFRQESFEASSSERQQGGLPESATGGVESAPSASSTSSSVYEIQPGETYWTISKNAYGTARYFRALAVHNRKTIPDPLKMQPGMKIEIPPAATLERSYPDMLPKKGRSRSRSVSSSAPTPGVTKTSDEPAGFFTNDDGKPMYRVGTNDTLSGIAQRHLGRSSRWIQIYHLNRQVLKSPDKLQPGLELRLPNDASRVEMVRRRGDIR